MIAGGCTVYSIEHAGESEIKGDTQQAPGEQHAQQGRALADLTPAAVICYREAASV